MVYDWIFLYIDLCVLLIYILFNCDEVVLIDLCGKKYGLCKLKDYLNNIIIWN